MSFHDRVERICRRDLDGRALRVALLDELRSAVPFEFYAWISTDPETCVGSDPVAETPSLRDLPTLIRLKYLTTTNRWTTLSSGRPVTLVVETHGDREQSRMWGELLDGYGIDDVASTVFRDQFGSWGFLDLWRTDGTFSVAECSLLQEFTEFVTAHLRRCLAPTFERGSGPVGRASGPAVLLLSEDLELLTQTPYTDAYLRELLPPEAGRSPVPAAAYNVAAQLLAQECGVDDHAPSTRVHVRDGLWVTLSAARIESRSPLDPATIAVSIEQTQPLERADLYARVVGLSERESEILRHLVGGSDTRELSDRLYVSEHTVQDHFKSIFAKTGVNSRRMLIARATGVA